MRKNHVLFCINGQVFLMSMMPAILELKRQNISFDVFVPQETKETKWQSSDECQKIADYLEKEDILAFRNLPEKRNYNTVYSPHPIFFDELAKLNSIKYYVKYNYYAVSGKPHVYYAQDVMNFYDFILCLCEPDALIFSAHAKSYSIGNIKLANYKRNRNVPTDKKTLLYLPTWGNEKDSMSSINNQTIKKLLDLKNKYKLAVKMHNITSFSKSEANRYNLLNEFDTIYDASVPVAEILNNSDIVLSDLSSVAFDAIVGDVPLALTGLGEPIFLGDKLCLHQQLVKDDIIPGTNDVNYLELVIERALTPEYFAKQQKLKKEMFKQEGKECLNAFVKFQDDLFNDNVDPWYIATRRAIRDSNIIHNKIRIEYENSTSWKVTRPLRGVAKLIKSLIK